MNYRKLYDSLIQQGSQSRSKGLERHHIVPSHANGPDDPDNLIYLTFRQHILAHLLLWKIHGRDGDLLAYKMMSGHTAGTRSLYSKLGGLVTGKRNAETGFINAIKTAESLRLGGIRGAEAGRSTNCFYNKEKHAIVAALGGKAQGKINASNGHLKEITKLSKRSSGQIWITDGTNSKMQFPELQIPTGWSKGRKCPRKN